LLTNNFTSIYLQPAHVEEELQKSEQWEEHVTNMIVQKLSTHEARQEKRVDR